jgi:hypothetical protein
MSTLSSFDLDLTTWLTVIILPVLGALFMMIQGVKREVGDRIELISSRKSEALMALRDDLSAQKLEVARSYAPLHAIRDIDRRLSLQLMRIEDKLDRLPRSPGLLQGRGIEQ